MTGLNRKLPEIAVLFPDQVLRPIIPAMEEAMASKDHDQDSRAPVSHHARRAPAFVRLAACTVLAATLAMAATPGAAADMQVTGRLVLSLGSGDWSLGLRADTDVRWQWRKDEAGNPPRPAVDLTARFSGPGFESLLLNGLPVAVRGPVLYADGTGEPASGVRWEYVGLGLAGAAALVLIVRETLADDFADELGDAIEGGN